MNQAETLYSQISHEIKTIGDLALRARAAAIQVFVSNPDFDDAKKYRFADGSELVITDQSAYVIN